MAYNYYFDFSLIKQIVGQTVCRNIAIVRESQNIARLRSVIF
jgi:hypothetical protein